jgi:hypothetical protein
MEEQRGGLRLVPAAAPAVPAVLSPHAAQQAA